MSASPLDSSFDNVELCPNCGLYTNQLVELTGWCAHCSGLALASSGNISSSSNKLELALAANSEAVEHYIIATSSVYKALTLARQDRPSCVVCGERMSRTSRSALFCRQHPECRRYSRRYVYLYSEKRPLMTKAEALASILTELTGE